MLPQKTQKKLSLVQKRYKQFQKERLAALAQEKDEKQNLLRLIDDADLQRLDDGRIRFRCDSLIITITPRDELVQIKDESENTPDEQ